MKSANAAIGAAAGFAALSAGLALLPERPTADGPQTWTLRGPQTWALRGTIAPPAIDVSALPQRQARL